MKKLAILGMGAMGSRMAARLVDAGYEVVVYNRNPARAQPLVALGAKLATTPRAAAEGADLVLTMLTDKDASRAVWLDEQAGAAQALSDGAVAIESSTLTPDHVATIGEAVTAHGAQFLDAPVVGTRPHAEGGNLVFLVGGDGEVLSRVAEPLSKMGKTKHVGAVGAGTRLKLCVNTLFGIQVAAYAEIFGLLRKAGAADSIDVLKSLPITSPVMTRVIDLMTAKSFSPNFPIELVAKDFSYACEAAATFGAAVPTAEAARDVFRSAVERGLGGDDISGIAQAY